MLKEIMAAGVAVLFLSSLATQALSDTAPRIPERLIDMHVHAWQSPPRDEHFRLSLQRAFSTFHLQRAVLSGPAASARAAVGLAPTLLLAGLAYGAGSELPPPTDFATSIQEHRVAVLGELDGAWDGEPLTAAGLEPYLSIAEAREIPVAVFTGAAPPGTAARFPKYRTELGRPSAVEPLVARHPRLRLYLMQAGWPFLEETIAVMHVHPGVYADLGNIVAHPTIPRAEFYRYLRALIGAGLGKRLMFGSGLDITEWAGGIRSAVESVAAAPFLSPSDRSDIFYANAERFLKLNARDSAR